MTAEETVAFRKHIMTECGKHQIEYVAARAPRLPLLGRK
jgi:hypothetical protein